MKHFRTAVDQELETCINGAIYCLMNMKNLREHAQTIGLREMLEARLTETDDE
jgi:hypothetical protein